MFNRVPNRIEPAGPAGAYETFQIKTPRGPEFERPATCQDVECPAWANGWITRVPATDDMLARLRESGRAWASVDQDGGEWVFTFPPGTECFASSTHRKTVSPELPQLFVVRDGDWRGNPTGRTRIHTRPEDWVEDFQEHTEAVRERIEKG